MRHREHSGEASAAGSGASANEAIRIHPDRRRARVDAGEQFSLLERFCQVADGTRLLRVSPVPFIGEGSDKNGRNRRSRCQQVDLKLLSGHPKIRISEIRQEDVVWPPEPRESSAPGNASATNPMALMRPSTASRTEESSSTIEITYFADMLSCRFQFDGQDLTLPGGVPQLRRGAPP
jgi:hypothetical protein